jgi:phosphoribosylformylglycinamidine synthase
VRAAQGCYHAALDYGAPFISGKDSLYNEYETEKENICVPPTLLISAMAVMRDVNKAVSMDAKKAGDLLYIAGLTYNELGGSHYYAIHGVMGNRVPQVNPKRGKRLMDSLSAAMDKGLVKACHDLSEGGIGVAAAEMGFAGNLGVTLDLKKVPLGENINRNDTILFSESNTRFLVEVTPENAQSFEEAMGESVCAQIGEFNGSDRLQVYGLDGETVISTPLAELKEAWQRPLRW